MANKFSSGSFSHNAITQTFGRLLYLITRVFLPPLILHYVSLDEYGLWAACFVVIGYITMGAFGISNVYIRYVSEFTVNQEQEQIGGLISTGLAMSLAFSVIAMTVVWLAIPWLMTLFSVAPDLQNTATVLILGTLAVMLLDITFGAFAYVLHGLHKIAEQTLIWIVSFLLETAMIVCMLMLNQGVIGLLWAFAVRYVFSTVLYIWMCYRSIPGLHLGFGKINRRHLKLFMRYGGILQISGLLSMALYSIERVIAGYFSGLGAVAVLDIGQKFPVMASQVLSSMNASFLPTMTRDHKLGKFDEIRRLYRSGLRYLSFLNGLAMGFLAPFAGLIIVAWMGPQEDLSSAIIVLTMACIGYHCNVLTGPLSAYYQGINKPAKTFIYLGLQCGFLILGFSLAWHHWNFDVINIAKLVMLARIGSTAIYLVIGNIEMGLSQRMFFRKVFCPGALPYLFGYTGWLVLEPYLGYVGHDRWQLLSVIAALGLIYCLLVIGYFYIFMCTRKEKNLIKQKLPI